MIAVYIAHPLGSGPDREHNRMLASSWVGIAFRLGVSPVADWITISGQVDESWRDQALEADKELVRRCNEVWLCGPRLSTGMRIEMDEATRCRIPVLDLIGIDLDLSISEVLEAIDARRKMFGFPLLAVHEAIEPVMWVCDVCRTRSEAHPDAPDVMSVLHAICDSHNAVSPSCGNPVGSIRILGGRATEAERMEFMSVPWRGVSS